MEPARDIYQRTQDYALRAINLFRYLRKQKNEDGGIIGRQYLRSATSVGANLVEADSAESRKDFVPKCGIALKEAKESRYWLRLLLQGDVIPAPKLDSLIDETQQLIAILASIIVKAKQAKGKAK